LGRQEAAQGGEYQIPVASEGQFEHTAAQPVDWYLQVAVAAGVISCSAAMLLLSAVAATRRLVMDSQLPRSPMLRSAVIYRAC
jgi:hypothetical protein